MIKQIWKCPIDKEVSVTVSNELIKELFCTQHGVRKICLDVSNNTGLKEEKI